MPRRPRVLHWPAWARHLLMAVMALLVLQVLLLLVFLQQRG
jgi:hypothetical protein